MPRFAYVQFLGSRIAEPTNANDVVPDAMPFDNVLVGANVHRIELSRSTQTRHVAEQQLELSDNWVRPWAIGATSRRSGDRENSLMPIVPTKFAMSAANTLLNHAKGAYHATDYGNSGQSWREEFWQAGMPSMTALQEDCTAIGVSFHLGIHAIKLQSVGQPQIETHLWWYSMCRSWTSHIKETKLQKVGSALQIVQFRSDMPRKYGYAYVIPTVGAGSMMSRRFWTTHLKTKYA